MWTKEIKSRFYAYEIAHVCHVTGGKVCVELSWNYVSNSIKSKIVNILTEYRSSVGITL